MSRHQLLKHPAPDAKEISIGSYAALSFLLSLVLRAFVTGPVHASRAPPSESETATGRCAAKSSAGMR